MMNPEEKKLKDNAKVVPLIALRGLVVFPNTTITVDVGRPKSVRALEEALRRDGKLFFAAQKELINIDPSKEEIFDVGTVCDVLQKIDLPNNNVRLLIKGQYKAKVVEYLKENDYFSVAVEEIGKQKFRYNRHAGAFASGKRAFGDVVRKCSKQDKQGAFDKACRHV